MAKINDEYDIKGAFDAIEDELIASMMRNMRRHKVEEEKEEKQWAMWQAMQLQSLEEYRQKNEEKFGKEFKRINGAIEELLYAARTEGGMEQEQKILKAIQKGYKGIMRKVGGGSLNLSGAFFQINDRKLEALINATMHDMEKAEVAVLRMANDQYRKIIYNAQVYANSGAGTYEKAVDMATHDFLSSGINCIEYANGTRHRIADYADMAIRTASKRAYLQGEGEKRKEWGICTVFVNKRGNACPKCLPFCGKVFIDDVWSGGPKSGISPVTGVKYPLLSKAIEAGLYHPRCRDAHGTYFEGISTPPDGSKYTMDELNDLAEKNMQEARKQYAKRQELRFGRLAKYSLDPENQAQYAAKQDEWKEQNYRAVERGESSSIPLQSEGKIHDIAIRKVTTYPGDVYVSDNATIKRRALYTITKNTEDAMKKWKIDLKRRPKIIIVSEGEMPTAYGKYVARQNVVFYVPEIVRNKEQGKIELHEMWHMRQAENFRKKYGEITRDNYGEYIKFACKEAKERIDKAGVTEYNVGEISKYAQKMYRMGRYDEVEAEYMVKRKAK